MSRWYRYDIHGDTLASARRELPSFGGVYVVYRHGSVVYVGQSKNVSARFGDGSTHPARLRTGDTVKVSRGRQGGLKGSLEQRLITKLHPPLNRCYASRWDGKRRKPWGAKIRLSLLNWLKEQAAREGVNIRVIIERALERELAPPGAKSA